MTLSDAKPPYSVNFCLSMVARSEAADFKGGVGYNRRFLANVLRYVRYMLSAVRLSVCLSVVCLLSVTLVHPTQAVEIFGNFFSPYDSSGTLLF